MSSWLKRPAMCASLAQRLLDVKGQKSNEEYMRHLQDDSEFIEITEEMFQANPAHWMNHAKTVSIFVVDPDGRPVRFLAGAADHVRCTSLVM